MKRVAKNSPGVFPRFHHGSHADDSGYWHECHVCVFHGIRWRLPGGDVEALRWS